MLLGLRDVTGIPGRCPDDGTCHHDCVVGVCFRVHCCGPLSGVFPDDEWPVEIVKTNQVRCSYVIVRKYPEHRYVMSRRQCKRTTTHSDGRCWQHPK